MLIASLQTLSTVENIPRLIAAANLSSMAQHSSEFRLLIDEDLLNVEIRRNGLGWGRNVTVAAAWFSSELDFQDFLQTETFSQVVRRALIESVLEQREMILERRGMERRRVANLRTEGENV